MRKVHFWCMRHGEHEHNVLTDRGMRRAAVVGKRYLKGVHFPWGWCTEAEQTRETLKVALAAAGHGEISVIAHDDVSHQWVDRHPELTQFAFPDLNGLRTELGRSLTAADILQRWQPAVEMRQRFIAWLHKEAMQSATYNDIIVGTHSLMGVLAAPDPDLAPLLEYGDICRYSCEVESRVVRIVNRVLLPCPPVL